ncbi:MAG: phosphatase PAP2 family protein [Clostridiales bacterium]|nr:phosphatase PAP2 family protein [Clostridiales bacterium]
MTAEDYQRLSAPFHSPAGEKGLNVANFVLTRLCYVAYPLALIVLAVGKDPRLLRCVLVPAVSFALLSVYRDLRNAPRPYEVLDIQPLIHKDKKGKSFPSRHVFSVFVIAMTFLWLKPWLGAAFLAVGVVLALCRVVGGVHWPRDVIAGAAVGVAAGLVGFWIV